MGTIALAEMLECEVGAVEAALVRLRDDLEARGSGIQLREVAGGWRLFTHPAYHELIEKYVLSGTRASFPRRPWRRWPSWPIPSR